MNNQLLKAEQVATALGVTPKTIRLWCQAGDVFPTARKLGNRSTGQWRILSDDIALLEMLDGAADNAAVLADQNQKIADLQTQIDECRANYETLNSAYHQSMAETDQLESEFKEVADNYNKLMSIHKDAVANHEAQVADLQRYKAHYEQQQKRQRGRKNA